MNRRVLLWLSAMLVCLSPPAIAQISTGNVYGKVLDEQGSVLPGAEVSLVATTIGGAPKTTVTDQGGEFRFLRLDPGNYRLAVGLSGFAKVERDVIVTTGQNVTVEFDLKVAAVEETLTVTAESPVVDVKKVGTSTTVGRDELELTPQSKDPWALLKTVPGVIVDRVNIGGNESGQQSGFAGKGARSQDQMWTMDGLDITDTDSGGASSSYYDMNAFDEVNVSTGGSDLRVQSGGVGINMVTRRGTNQYRGTIYDTIASHKLQANNTPSVLLADPRLGGNDEANRTDQITNYGFDAGGPILKDRLWAWGSWGKQDIRIVRLNQTKDRTILKDSSIKVNSRLGSADDLSLFWFDNAKEKFGRSTGAAGTEADSFLWNQGNFYPDGPHGVWKGELNHVFGPSLFLNARYAWFGWGYGFSPRGGEDQDGAVDYVQDLAYGSWFTYQSLKSWHITDVNGSAFKNALGAGHEFKFGFGYIRRPSTSLTRWSGSQVVGYILSPDEAYAKAFREANKNFISEGWHAYFGDTVSRGHMTLNAGLRWDRQTAENRASTVAANPTFPKFLPALDFPGNDQKIKWNDVSPRVGVSYALDDAHKTVVRGSYAMYAGQINSYEVTNANPAGTYYTYIAYKWADANHDGFAQKNEILTDLGPQYWNGLDPNNPASTDSPHRIDPNYKANHDHEIIVGIDREVMPNFAVGAAYTWRRGNSVPNWFPRIGLTSADYTPFTVTARGETVQVYAPDDALVEQFGGGRVITNRPDYHTSYSGLEFTVNKRLANRWMTRAAFSWNNATEHFDGPGAVQNPTRSDSDGGSPATFSGPQVDGGQLAPRSTGSGKGDIFYNAKWQLNVNGLYELPWDIQFAGSLFGRQGYALPFVIQARAGGDGTVRALARPKIDDNRYDSVWNLDLRLAKKFRLYRDTNIEVSADIFNVLNNDVVLAQTRRLDSDAFGTINEVIAPRIMRLGLRFQF